MYQDQQSGSQRWNSAEGESPDTDREARSTKSDEWSDIKDPSERRKIQNKLAQRRFRDKVKEQKEEAEREEENRRRAGSSYASPEPETMDNNQTLSGLPWGGISMKHIVETGKNKEQNSQQSSQDNSVQGSSSHTGGRLGLRLTDRFARGNPALKHFRYFPYRYAGQAQR
ncbi:uncharacterized protein K460DRAFT_282787 [Cucurbitaria berberidis CBS 394.84]|uniref:BZIP domain-containing protein n=1 Tax=Cucurbitaria berberidis CBS 394.84 TaxID=1168544 RepID=A0A9P4L925_9PLEO|nr:uncharacterized protein K460DRAFT_282787 [Cucurbitaria berberidis CBS 394.84]KAF1845947.1 hypothetical protein K460DRAFT_282787 [Cucurbitaria berberidis CBS 394.84]